MAITPIIYNFAPVKRKTSIIISNNLITKQMKNFTTLKTLLVGLCAMGATSAWADTGDVTTNADIDFSNAISEGAVAGKVNSMTIGATTNFNTEIASDENGQYLFLGDGINTVTIPSAQYAGKNDVVTIQFDMAIADGSNNHAAFYIQDADGGNIGYMKCALWDAGSLNETNLGIALNTTTFNKNSTNPKDALWGKRTSFTITLDYLNKTITTVSQIQGKSALAPIVVTMTNSNPVAKFIVQAWPSQGAGGAARRAKFGNLLIKTTEGDNDTQTYEYTVNWSCDGSIIKSETRYGVAEAEISLGTTDKESFVVDGQKYIYVKDNSEGSTVSDEGNTVVTIEMREAATWDFTVNAMAGEENLGTIYQGKVTEGDAASYGYSQYILVDNVLYKSAAQSGNPWWGKSFTPAADGESQSITYEAQSETGIIFCSEAEDIEGATVVSGGNTDIRASNRKGAYGTNVKIMTLEPGSYKIYSALYGNAGSTITFNAGGKEVFAITTNGNPTHTASEEFNIYATTDLTFNGGNGGTSAKVVDYVIVQKTGDVELPENVTVEVSDAGWATLFSDYALNFEGTGLTAYTATLSESTVTLTEVTSVTAGTGVVLKGEANTYEIPVIDGSDTAKGDLKGNATAATTADGSQYILVMNGSNAQFTKATSGSIAAGKAYLEKAESESRILNVVFAGEATGIKAIETAKADGNVYNMAGQRVAAPKKGLFIMNGKKVIIK